MPAFASIRDRLRLPLIAAPMFRVSGVELVTGACRNGVIGAFPTANCRTAQELDEWLSTIRQSLRETDAAAWCANLIVHRSNPRPRDDLTILLRHAPRIVITSIGSPAEVIAHCTMPEHWCCPMPLRHAERAIEAGADGLVLLAAGASGQTGWLQSVCLRPCSTALLRRPLVLAGGISDGHAPAAALALGCDLGYMGTRFIATNEVWRNLNTNRCWSTATLTTCC